MQVLTLPWRHRALFMSFLRREVSSRYVGTAAGALWALGQPLLMLAIYAFVFQRVLGVQFESSNGHGFVVFLACGLWPWMAFHEAVLRGTQSITDHAGLVSKVAFPRELLVAAGVAGVFAIHLAGFVVVLVLLALLGPGFSILGLLPALAAWGVFALMAYAWSLLTASLQVVVRDVSHFIGPLLMLWFYLSPVLYPRSLVPEEFQWVVDLNPVAQLLGVIREALMEADWQPAWALLPMLLLGLLMLAAAHWVFRRLSPRFEDFL